MLYLPINIRYTLKKQDRLKSQKLIEHLFSKGKSFSVFPVKVLYQFVHLQPGVHLQAGFAVSKRNFKKAVDRNRIKRLLREAYRLQKNELKNELQLQNLELAIFLVYTGKDLPAMVDMMEKMKAVLFYLSKKIKENK